MAMETGPLAQVLISYLQQDPDIQPLVRTVLHTLNAPLDALFSTLGRTAARGIEAAAIAQKMERWLARLRKRIDSGDTMLTEDCTLPDSARGVGFVTAPRGGLSHWMVIEKKKIVNYQMIVPSTWNFGPRCARGIPSAVEEALVGTPVADPKRPVEILRTVHSFDPCLACAIHVIDGRSNETRVFRAL
jgi:[NiFe] hydrogenase large subunit